MARDLLAERRKPRNLLEENQSYFPEALDILGGIGTAASNTFDIGKALGKELLGVAKHPIRSAQNIAGSIPTYGQQLNRLAGHPIPESILPGNRNYFPEGKQAGDELTQSAASAFGLGGLGELGALSKLARFGARTGAGALQGLAANKNAVETGLTNAISTPILELLFGKLASIPRIVKGGTKNIEDRMANKALDIANKQRFYGGSLHPEEAAQNALQNFTTVEGERAPVDFGSLINNESLKDLYRVTSKIPLTGGRQKLTQLQRDLIDKAEAKATLAHGNEITGINEKQRTYFQQLNDALRAQQEHQRISSNIEGAPHQLNALRHPTEGHDEHLKVESTKAYNTAKEESTALYRPVNEFHEDLSRMKTPPNFRGRYRHESEYLQQHSQDLTDLFGNDRDLGTKVVQAIKSSRSFFNNEDNLSGQARIGNFQPVRMREILEHIRTLQKGAAVLRDNGHNTQAANLQRMATALKDDTTDILNHNGHRNISQALETANQHHIKEILPFYGKKHLRDTVRKREFIPNGTTLSTILHDPNYRAVLRRLPEQARRAAAFELITKGKYSSAGQSNLTPEQIATKYQSLTSTQKQAINEIEPHLDRYFESLNQHIRRRNELEPQVRTIERTRQRLERTNEETRKANESLQKAFQVKFGKPTKEVKSYWASIKNMSPLNAAGAGTLLYSMGGGFPKKIIEGIGGAIPLARLINSALTNPELLSHYIKGTKLPIKEATLLENKIREGLKKTANYSVRAKSSREKE